MNYGEVKQLLDAGFTHDEIMSIIGNNPQNPQTFQQMDSMDDPEPAAVNLEPAAVNPEPAAVNPEPADDNGKFDQLNETMNRLIRTIQSSNLQNASINTMPDKIDLATEVDKVMASIIRPEKEGSPNER